MQPGSAPNYSAMSGAELNAEAARLMGWKEIAHIRDSPLDTGVICNGSPVRNDSGVIYRFAPTIDLNDTARLCAAFLAAWPEYRIVSFVHRDRCYAMVEQMVAEAAGLTGARRFSDVFEGPSEARCRTEAVCAARNALNELGR